MCFFWKCMDRNTKREKMVRFKLTKSCYFPMLLKLPIFSRNQANLHSFDQGFCYKKIIESFSNKMTFIC